MEPGVAFGLAAAAAFGAGDFSGGLAARRAPAWIVAAGAQLAGLAMLVLLAAVVRPEAPDPSAIILGGAAGIAGGLGLAALYAGLSLGSMGLVAALSGAGSVAIPVVVGVVLLRDAISAGQWTGVAAAAGAAVLASGATAAGVNARAVRLALVAAVGFGLWFVLLDQAADADQLWVLVASRGTAAAVVGSLSLLMAGGRGLPRALLPVVVMAGALDVAGNGAFVLSAASVPVGIAAALSGLYPLVTMLLARLVLRERLPALALVAVALAVAGILLVSLG
jgi:drug/metabolite transporter (DMT)-like permease